ncbi:hypothetical protein EYF80_028924 [Liparis tanakae]|uniref:Uncharacterized protein n=1 Tax=Liparis tanakae TaxID=230148 RepID=A0A4Z2H580_9TELE|nr:hypothetical protein EYF80_028924 [Liparis tanakae]
MCSVHSSVSEAPSSRRETSSSRLMKAGDKDVFLLDRSPVAMTMTSFCPDVSIRRNHRATQAWWSTGTETRCSSLGSLYQSCSFADSNTNSMLSTWCVRVCVCVCVCE